MIHSHSQMASPNAQTFTDDHPPSPFGQEGRARSITLVSMVGGNDLPRKVFSDGV